MILLRHGQSEFNLHFTATRRDPGIFDPRLTELGHSQAEQAAEQLADQGIRRIIVSPYTRALQTAHPVAARLGVPVSVDPIVRERFAFACDIGSPRAALERDWPGHDFSAVEEVWWPAEEEPEAGIVGRAARFRNELEDYMAEDQADETLKTIVSWARYGELFAYDEQTESFSLENPH